MVTPRDEKAASAALQVRFPSSDYAVWARVFPEGFVARESVAHCKIWRVRDLHHQQSRGGPHRWQQNRFRNFNNRSARVTLRPYGGLRLRCRLPVNPTDNVTLA